MEEIRLIIAGTRTFNDYRLLKKTILQLILMNEEYDDIPIKIISGGARGADTLGERFACEYDMSLSIFKPDWKLGKLEGKRRNVSMARHAVEPNCASILIAFWDGKSRGTAHMIVTATKMDFSKVYIVNYEEGGRIDEII